jgi:DNA-binding NarL/FixJ family response regulator
LVLVACARELIREGLAALCERTGRYQIAAQCADGFAALAALRDRRPDIVILDLELPGVHTLELILRLREEGIPARVIVIAERAGRATVLGALRAGASGVIQFSDTVRDLINALDHASSGGIFLPDSAEAGELFQSSATRPDDPLSRLSRREHQVYQMLVEGVRPKEIAARLDLSAKTVDSHRKNLMRKLEIFDVAGLVKFAMKRDLGG